MRDIHGDSFDEATFCLTCGNPLSARLYGSGAFECRDCERGLFPEWLKGAEPPSAEYLAGRERMWRESGCCYKCGTPPNGDQLVDGVCQACVLAKQYAEKEPIPA